MSSQIETIVTTFALSDYSGGQFHSGAKGVTIVAPFVFWLPAIRAARSIRGAEGGVKAVDKQQKQETLRDITNLSGSATFRVDVPRNTIPSIVKQILWGKP